MEILILLIFGFFIYKFGLLTLKPSKKEPQTIYTKPETQSNEPNKANDVEYAYKARNLFTNYEKKQYINLKKITDELGLTIFAKVRLADILESKTPNNYSAFNKIKAKHIDFLICKDTDIICCLEIDDSSHNQRNRIERDNFVDKALVNAGIWIIHTRQIQENDEGLIKNLKMIMGNKPI